MKIKRILTFIIGIILLFSIVLNIYVLNQISMLKSSTSHANNTITNNITNIMKQLKETDMKLTSNSNVINNLMKSEKEITGELPSFQYYKTETNELSDNLRKITKLVYHLPQISKRLAFVKKLSVESNITFVYLDYIDWFSGDDAFKAATEDNQPNASSLNNSFYIRNSEKESIKYELKPDTLIFELDGAQLKYSSYEQFIKENVKDRLFHISFVENKIVLLEEQYRP